MPRMQKLKTSFTAGEVSERLLGRGDLTAYTNGARRLRNVQVFPTGGVVRRPGLRYVAEAPGRGRLIAFEFNTEQTCLILITHRTLTLYQEDKQIAQLVSPWTQDQISQLTWTQSADTLLICHPQVTPQRLYRTDATSFRLEAWAFHTAGGCVHQPYYKFIADSVTLQPSGTSGTITLTASADVFLSEHAGVRFRVAGQEVKVTEVIGPRVASATVKQTLVGTSATIDWEEQAFSTARGWPVSACFHQDRLVIGGSRDLPNRIWLSKSSDLFNFDLGEGEDDEAIEFAILSDQVNAVRAVFSGRHLQVFTSGAEWMVTGDPLTPSNIQLRRQTRVGSPVDRSVPPRDVDGATLYISRTGTELREFLFADVEQAYQSNDLALLARHLMNGPVDQDFQKTNRLMYVVMTDGSIGAVTIYRQEQVTAWTLFETAGHFHSVCAVGDEVYVLVLRDDRYFVERFDSSLNTDCAHTAISDAPKILWNGLDHLEGQTVQVVADGIPRTPALVKNGQIILSEAASSLKVGLAYAHQIVPLPPYLEGLPGAGQGASARLVQVTFRLLEARSLSVDVGAGLRKVPFRRLDTTEILDQPAPPFTGDHTVRALGWTQNGAEPLWQVHQDDPLPCAVLSVLTEVFLSGF